MWVYRAKMFTNEMCQLAQRGVSPRDIGCVVCRAVSVQAALPQSESQGLQWYFHQRNVRHLPSFWILSCQLCLRSAQQTGGFLCSSLCPYLDSYNVGPNLGCVRMSLLGGSTAKMVKTACKVLLFTAHFSQEGRVIPWKILGSADLYP